MRRLIIADVHANLPAFQAVLDAAGSRDSVWFLGDIAGWGPNPGECIDLLRQIDAVCVMGNHDREICNLPNNNLPEWPQAIHFLHFFMLLIPPA